MTPVVHCAKEDFRLSEISTPMPIFLLDSALMTKNHLRFTHGYTWLQFALLYNFVFLVDIFTNISQLFEIVM